MRLSEFLVTHREQILAEWVAFARSCLPNAEEAGGPSGMSPAALRDHAAEMLEAIAADLKTRQSRGEQADKAEGKSDAPPAASTPDTAAQAHGAGRAESGFTLEQMVSEYRALRANVVRLWMDAEGELAVKDIHDLIRFNEAIDQALAESTSRFAQELRQSREMFLAMLGHDLRDPLGAIIGSASILATSKGLPQPLLKKVTLILNSGQRMNALVGDLLDFTRSRLGRGIPITRGNMDLAKVGRHAVDEIAALHPQRVLSFEATGKLRGQWDGARVGQALSNLISNAVQHGSDTSPIAVTIHGDADEVRLAVHNSGPVIPTNQRSRIFDPMQRIENDKRMGPRSNLGLGLYIAERIVKAHGGTIGVESSKKRGTTFTIHLPKRLPTAPSRPRVEPK